MKKGFTLIEVLVSFGMMSVIMASLYPIVSWLITRSKFLQYDASASILLQEGAEVAYNVIVPDWSSFTDNFSDGDYHPAIDASATPPKWTLVSNPETNLEARFERVINIASVCRDNSTGEIVAGTCGGTSAVDKNSKIVTTTVKWTEQQKEKSISSTLLVTNLNQ